VNHSHISKCSTLLGALISAAIFSSSTQAQNNPGASVSVATSAMNPVIVTANRTPTAASNVLADYDYIGPEEIAQAGQTSFGGITPKATWCRDIKLWHWRLSR
jgi:outer membrane cobalamin receptor